MDKISFKNIFNHSVPVIVTQLAVLGAGLVDVIMASNFSTEALSIVSVSNNFFFFFIVVFIGLTQGISTIVSAAYARSNYHVIRTIFASSLSISILFTIAIFFVFSNSSDLLYFFGIKEDLVSSVDDYLMVMRWGLLPYFGYLVLKSILEGMLRPKVVTFILLLSIPLNAALNYLLVYTNVVVEPMGAIGIAWATNLVWCFIFLFFLIYFRHRLSWLFKHKPNIKLRIFKKVTLTILDTGIPTGLSRLSESSFFSIVGLIIPSYGLAQVGAHQIAMTISSLIYIFYVAWGVSISNLMSFVLSNKSCHEDVKLLMGVAYYFVVGTGAVFSLTLYFLPNSIINIFSDDPEVVSISSKLLVFVMFYILLEGLQVMSFSILRAFGDTKFAFVTCLVSYWIIGFPVGYFLSFDYGIFGYWSAFVVSILCSFIVLTLRVYEKYYDKMKSVLSPAGSALLNKSVN